MDGVYASSGKRAHAQLENEPVETNDRNKRRNSGTGGDQASLGADSTVYRILCPGNVIGSVIGKGGKVIKSLRQETRAKIKVADPIPGVDERVIIIYSSSTEGEDDKDDSETEGNENEPVCPAQDALLRVHSVIAHGTPDDDDIDGKAQVTVRLLVPNSQIGNLIGKGGKTIKKMRSDSGAQIRVSPKDELPPCAMSTDELVQISGPAKAVKKALYEVSACLYKHPPKEQLNLNSVPPIASQGSLLPAGASFLHPVNYLQGNSVFPHHNVGASIVGVAPHIPGFGGYGGETGAVWPLSSSGLPLLSSVGGQALKRGSDEFSIRILCPNDKIGSVIGKGGNSIKSLRQDTGANIKVEDPVPEAEERVILVSSTEFADDRVSPTVEAIVQLQGKTSETTDKEGVISTRLLVPSKQIGCLLGKGGSIINEMRKKTRANIRISPKEDRPKCASENEELVQIIGEANVARDALIQIITRLRENVFKDKDGAGNDDSGLPSSVSALGFSGCIPISSNYGARQDLGIAGGRLSGSFGSYGALQSGVSAYGHLPAYASSRTLGGGSPGGRLKSSYGTPVEVTIPSSAVGSVLGRGGINISNIRQISGASVKLHDPVPGALDRVVEISGTPEQTHAAQSLIQAFMLTGQSQQAQVTSRKF